MQICGSRHDPRMPWTASPAGERLASLTPSAPLPSYTPESAFGVQHVSHRASFLGARFGTEARPYDKARSQADDPQASSVDVLQKASTLGSQIESVHISAPTFSFSRAGRGLEPAPPPHRPASLAPHVEAVFLESSLGRQRSSRKSTYPAFTFGSSARFPEQAPASPPAARPTAEHLPND